MAPPITPTSAEPIAEDVLCIQCQYNLRTRRPGERCPECNYPITDTLAHYQNNAGAILGPGLLWTAAWCFAIPCFLSLLSFGTVYGLQYWAGHGGPPWLPAVEVSIQYVAHMVFAAALVIGVLLVAASVNRRMISAGTRTALVLLAAAYAAANTLVFLAALALVMRPRGRPMRVFIPLLWLREQRISSALLCLVMALAGLSLMRNLAKALASPRLMQWTNFVFVSVILDYSLALLLYFFAGTWRLTRNAFQNVSQFDGLFLAIDLPTTAIAVGLGVYWLFVARTIREKTRQPLEPEIVYPAPPARDPGAKIDQFLAHQRSTNPG